MYMLLWKIRPKCSQTSANLITCLFQWTENCPNIKAVYVIFIKMPKDVTSLGILMKWNFNEMNPLAKILPIRSPWP
jgi:hypothetical protein